MGKLVVVPIEDKMKVTYLRWFGHVRRRPVYATVKDIDSIEVIGTTRRKKRPKKLG